MEEFYGYFDEMLYIWQYFNLNFIPFFIVQIYSSQLVRELYSLDIN